MRGEDRSSGNLFSYVDLEHRVPSDHPLRLIRAIVNDVLASLSKEFETLYSPTGRPSIPPEQLFLALIDNHVFGESGRTDALLNGDAVLIV